jgi:CBS domain-containing protein
MSPGVSEADLLSVLDKRARHAQLEPGGRLHRHAGDKRHLGLTAGELMTSPAITIHPDATLSAAARLMNSRHLKRLLGRLGAAQRQVPPPESWPRLAGIESIQAFEAPKTIQALIVGRDITGRRRSADRHGKRVRPDSL